MCKIRRKETKFSGLLYNHTNIYTYSALQGLTMQQPILGVQQPGMRAGRGRSRSRQGPIPVVQQPGMMGSMQQSSPGVPGITAGWGRPRQGPTLVVQQPGMTAGQGLMQQPTPGVQHPGMIAGLGGVSVDAALPDYIQASTPSMGQPSKPPTTRLGPNGDFTEQISPFGPICTPAPIEPIYPTEPIRPIFHPEPNKPICPPRPICPPDKTDHDPAMSQTPNNILNSESGNRLMSRGYFDQGPNCPGRLRCSQCGPTCFGGPIRQNFGTHGVSVQALKSLQQLKVSKFLKI
jgi:hypothetical protein